MERNEYESLLVKYYPSVFNFSMKLCRAHREDAEDLCHQVMLKALTRPPASTHSLLSWLFSITYNEHINNYKHKNSNPADSYETIYAGTVDPDQYVLIDFDQAVDMINHSRSWHSKALMMYAEGYKYKEISDLLHKNIDTVKSGIFQMRMKLKGEFGMVA